MDQYPKVVSTDSLSQAWDATIANLNNSPDGAIANLIVHVATPSKELPNSFFVSPEFVESWATELQSELPVRLPFTHGERIRRWLIQTVGGKYSFLDQINDFVVPMLARNPKTKRAVLQIADPNQDALVSDEPIPALQLIQFAIEDSKLVCTAYYRAQEMYLFWVVNMFELMSLQEYICRRISERSPELLPTPGSITTHAFRAYANPTDLIPQDSSHESPTLAIELFEMSKMKLDDFDTLLERSFTAGDIDSLNHLYEMLSVDLRKLNRIRTVDYSALERLKIFLQEYPPRDTSELADLSRRLLSEIVAFDVDLERSETLDELSKNLSQVRAAWHDLLAQIDVLRKKS